MDESMNERRYDLIESPIGAVVIVSADDAIESRSRRRSYFLLGIAPRRPKSCARFIRLPASDFLVATNSGSS